MKKEKYGKHTLYRNKWMEFCTGWIKAAFRQGAVWYREQLKSRQ